MSTCGRSEIDGQPLLLPVAIAHGFWSIPPAQFFRQRGFGFGSLAALFGFGQGALGGWRQVVVHVRCFLVRHPILI